MAVRLVDRATGEVPMPGTPMPCMAIPDRSIIIVLDMYRTPFLNRLLYAGPPEI
jgi:hypothetical protein